jgi:hypothetical protein
MGSASQGVIVIGVELKGDAVLHRGVIPFASLDQQVAFGREMIGSMNF